MSSIQSLRRQLQTAERDADERGISESKRKSRLEKLAKARVDLAKAEARELEQRGASRW